MTAGIRSLAIAAAAVSAVFIVRAAFLHAQDVTDLPVSDAAQQSASDATLSGTVDGVMSGEISTAKHAMRFDTFLRDTLFRISDCWTLCRQEIILAKEYAHQETLQTAETVYRKSVDAAVEQGGAILENLPLVSQDEHDAASGN